jgi:hypothetical protein
VGFPDRQGRGAPGGWDIGFRHRMDWAIWFTNPISVQVRRGSAVSRRSVSIANEIFCRGRNANKSSKKADGRGT